MKKRKLMLTLKAESRGAARRSASVEQSGVQ